MIRVSIVSLSARSGDDVAVGFEISNGNACQRETFIVSTRIVADLGLRIGESNSDVFDAVSESAEIYSAHKRGLNILAYGRCSDGALCRKLVAKGFARETAKRAVEILLSEGYIDPYADALREAEVGVGKLWGRRRIAASLFEKGYSDDSIRAALLALEEDGTDFADICEERIRKTLSEVPTDRTQRQKLVASLQRYGFSTSEIREAFQRF